MLHIKLMEMSVQQHACMHIFLAHFFLTIVSESKGKNNFFLKVVMLQIKLKRKKHTTTYANKNYVLTLTLEPYVGFKTFFSLKTGHVVYQINQNEASGRNANKKFDQTHPQTSSAGTKG